MVRRRLEPPIIPSLGIGGEGIPAGGGAGGDGGSGGGSLGDLGSGVGSGDGREQLFQIDPGTGGDAGRDDYVRDADGNIKRNRDGTPRRKRGRKAGLGAQGGSGQKVSRTDAVNNLTGVLMMLHAGLATAAKAPELNLEEGEARMLADPLAQIAEHYNFAPSKEVQLAMALIGAAGMVYGPRVINIRNRLKKEAQEKRKNAPGQHKVVQGPWPAPQPVVAEPLPPLDPEMAKRPPLSPESIPPEMDAANMFRFEPAAE